MKKEVKSIQFFAERSELNKVSLNEVRGGKQVTDYASGCPSQHHMSYQASARLSLQ